MIIRFVRFLVWLFLFLSIVILLYIFYRAEVIHSHLQNAAYLPYYLIFVTSIFFWVMVIFLKDQTKKKIVLFTISLIVVFYMTEIFLNYKNTPTKMDIVENLINKGEEALPTIQLGEAKFNDGKNFFHISRGVSMKETILCSKAGKYITYKSDRYGFYNPDPVWDSSFIDWILIGDSLTHGHCFNPDDGLAGQLRSITGENIIELFWEGGGPLKMLATLQEYTKLAKPKKIIWVYHEGDDQIDIVEEKNNEILISYLKPKFTQNLINRQMEIDKLINDIFEDNLKRRKSILHKTKFLRLYETRSFVTKFLHGNYFTYKRNIKAKNKIDPIIRDILLKAKNITEAWEGKIYLVYLPENNRYKNKIKDHGLYNKRTEFIKLVESLKISVIDIHKETFSKISDPLTMYENRQLSHNSTKGFNVIAKTIVKKIGDN